MPIRTLCGHRPPRGRLETSRVYHLECGPRTIVHRPEGVFRDPCRFAVPLVAGSPPSWPADRGEKPKETRKATPKKKPAPAPKAPTLGVIPPPEAKGVARAGQGGQKKQKNSIG